MNTDSDTPRSQTETFRIPGKLHRLWLPMLIVALLAWSVPVIPIVRMDGLEQVVYAVLVVFVLALLARRYAWVIPRRVEVSPGGLRIVWLLRSRLIPAARIADAQLVLWETIQPPDRWSRDGAHGLWDSPDLGPCRIHATAPANLAMVYLADAPPLLLGVEFADELVEAVEADILHRGSLL